jgi:hypothetical protein
MTDKNRPDDRLQANSLTPEELSAHTEAIVQLFAEQSRFLVWMQQIMERASAENAFRLASSDETKPLIDAVPAMRATLERLGTSVAFPDARPHLFESLDYFEQGLALLLESNQKRDSVLTARAATILLRSGTCYERGKELVFQRLNEALIRQAQELLEAYSLSRESRPDG